MIDIHSYSNWNTRPSELQEQREPKRRYLFICEGERTEVGYIEGLRENARTLGINSLVDIEVYRKEKGESGGFAPEKLLSLADKENRVREIKKNGDKIVVVFDTDVLTGSEDKYKSILERGRKAGYEFAVTYPCFELFLALHLPDAFHSHIEPQAEEMLRNEKTAKQQRYIGRYVSEITHHNTKNGSSVRCYFPKDVKNAISEEKFLNQDIDFALGRLTSNVGKLFNELLFSE